MSERYSEGRYDEAAGTRAALEAEWRLLLARLLPDVDVDLLVHALREEEGRSGQPAPALEAAAPLPAAERPAAERELERVRSALALGASARMLQHAINNPLTALLAEAQLLELEVLGDSQRTCVGRIVELARRVAAVVRRLDAGPPPPAG